jgi:SAM-dependent methyltransferase
MRKAETQPANSSAIAARAPLRPPLRERTRYEPNLPQEDFIVPLLKREIESCIASYATPARGAAHAIDVGCGGQPFRELLRQAGYSYCGVDVNPNGGLDPDFLWAADEPIPEELARRGPFDFLLCTEVLEHVADWHAAFANFALLLAPGGRALLTAPFVYQLHEEPYDFWRPTLHSIDHYARAAGLLSVYRKAAGDPWDVLGTILATCGFLPASQRITDRALSKAMRTAGRFVHRAILRGKLQSRVRVDAPLYLSNVVVLEKSG